MSFNTNYNNSINYLLLSLIFTVSGMVMANQQSSYKLIDGVVVDKDGVNIYVINPEKGLDSVSLNTGLITWHSDSVTLPIMVNNGQLLAQEENHSIGELSLKSLDVANGAEIQTKNFSLPNNISAPIVDDVSRQFKINANFENNPNGEILWTYSYKLAQGMLSQNPPKAVKSYGLISQDSSRSLSSMKMQILQQAHNTANKSIVGEFLNNLQLDSDSRQFISLDEKYILVSKLKDDPSKWNKYAWNIYDREGALIGSTSHASSYSPFFVSGKTIIFVNQPNSRMINNNWVETPLTLQAVSLESSQLIWDKEVRNLKFNGPYPH